MTNQDFRGQPLQHREDLRPSGVVPGHQPSHVLPDTLRAPDAEQIRGGIRRMTAADLQEVYPLIKNDPKLAMLPQEEDLARQMIEKGEGVLLIARSPSGQVTGALFGGTSFGRGTISHLWVERNWRSHGLGKMMVEESLAAFYEQGARMLHVMTVAGNERATQFWTDHVQFDNREGSEFVERTLPDQVPAPQTPADMTLVRIPAHEFFQGQNAAYYERLLQFELNSREALQVQFAPGDEVVLAISRGLPVAALGIGSFGLRGHVSFLASTQGTIPGEALPALFQEAERVFASRSLPRLHAFVTNEQIGAAATLKLFGQFERQDGEPLLERTMRGVLPC